MTDDQIIEMAKQLYGAALTDAQLHTHKTIEFARLIERQARFDSAQLVETLPAITCGYKGIAAAIRKGG